MSYFKDYPNHVGLWYWTDFQGQVNETWVERDAFGNYHMMVLANRELGLIPVLKGSGKWADIPELPRCVQCGKPSPFPHLYDNPFCSSECEDKYASGN